MNGSHFVGLFFLVRMESSFSERSDESGESYILLILTSIPAPPSIG